MKKLVLILALMFLASPVFAETHYYINSVGPQGPAGANGTDGKDGMDGTNASVPDSRYGVMADAPHLIRLFPNWFLGAEGGKDLNDTSASRGWFAYAKVTYEGTLLDFSKK